MKSRSLFNTLLLSVSMFLGMSLSAQVINVPEKSQKDFTQRYPEAKEIVWKNNVSAYAARFKQEDHNFTARYNIDGTWDYTEKAIDSTEFPEAVKTSVKNSRYSDWKALSTAYVENKNNEKLYRIELKKGISRKYVFYDETGKEVKSSTTL